MNSSLISFKLVNAYLAMLVGIDLKYLQSSLSESRIYPMNFEFLGAKGLKNLMLLLNGVSYMNAKPKSPIASSLLFPTESEFSMNVIIILSLLLFSSLSSLIK